MRYDAESLHRRSRYRRSCRFPCLVGDRRESVMKEPPFMTCQPVRMSSAFSQTCLILRASLEVLRQRLSNSYNFQAGRRWLPELAHLTKNSLLHRGSELLEFPAYVK
jgi:hypothetical protein